MDIFLSLKEQTETKAKESIRYTFLNISTYCQEKCSNVQEMSFSNTHQPYAFPLLLVLSKAGTKAKKDKVSQQGSLVIAAPIL